MGLITKEVKIVLSSSNVKRYESLGYEIPKKQNKYNKIVYDIGSEIKVETNDLPLSSQVKVDIKCDSCKKIITRLWQSYQRYKKDDGRYYCNGCSHKLYGAENIRKIKLKNGLSFAKWCTENDKEDVLLRWSNINNFKPDEISYASDYKIWFDCPSSIHTPEFKKINNFTSGHEGVMDCKACNSFAQWGIDHIDKNFLNKYWDYDKNKDINPWEISKGTSRNKVWIKCQNKDYHVSYLVSCGNFTNKDNRCPLCSNKNGKVHPLDSLGELLKNKELLSIWSSENKKSPYEYAPFSKQKVYWKCVEGEHDDYLRTIHNSNICNFQCPKCIRERDESFLQEKVRKYCNELGYIILHEHSCTICPVNPKTNRILPFDNEVVDLKLIIEVHGIQHYKIVGFHQLDADRFGITPEQSLEYQQWKDKYKKDYALSQGYFYLEVPYRTDNESETWKELINNTIEEIKKVNIKQIG